MYFAVFAQDKPDQGDLRNRLRPAHRAWLRDPGQHPIKVHLGGPLLNAKGRMNGTLLVIEAANADQVHAFLAEDPYCANQLFAKLEVCPWQWSLGHPPLIRSATHD